MTLLHALIGHTASRVTHYVEARPIFCHSSQPSRKTLRGQHQKLQKSDSPTNRAFTKSPIVRIMWDRSLGETNDLDVRCPRNVRKLLLFFLLLLRKKTKCSIANESSSILFPVSWMDFTNKSHCHVPPFARYFDFGAIQRWPLITFLVSSNQWGGTPTPGNSFAVPILSVEDFVYNSQEWQVSFCLPFGDLEVPDRGREVAPEAEAAGLQTAKGDSIIKVHVRFRPWIRHSPWQKWLAEKQALSPDSSIRSRTGGGWDLSGQSLAPIWNEVTLNVTKRILV